MAADAAQPVDDRRGRGAADGLAQIMTPDEERWAEALAIERQHGADARYFIAKRLGELALAGDTAGATRLQAIAARLDQLRIGQVRNLHPQ